MTKLDHKIRTLGLSQKVGQKHANALISGRYIRGRAN
jgi:hypothetical protein